MTDFATLRTMMVDTQVRPSDVTKFPIIDAMLSVARENFVPASERAAAYRGDHLALGPQRVVLEPRTFAKILDALAIAPDEAVLDIGSGLGYSAAILARLAHDGAVVAVEEEAAHASEAEQGLAEAGADNVAVVEGQLVEGAAKAGPYDVIVIEGGVETVPDPLLDQLREGGRIAALFMDGRLGTVRIGYKIDGRITWRDIFNASAPVMPGFSKTPEFSF